MRDVEVIELSGVEFYQSICGISCEGDSIHDVRTEGGRGSINAANLHTKHIHFANKEGGSKNPKNVSVDVI